MILQNLNIRYISDYYGLSDSKDSILLLKGNNANMQHFNNRPLRPEHYTIFIATRSTTTIQVNLMDIHLNENDLLVIPPFSIIELLADDVASESLTLFFTSQYLLSTNFFTVNFSFFHLFDDNRQPIKFSSKDGTASLRLLLETLLLKLSNVKVQAVSNEVINLIFQAFLLELSDVHTKSEDFPRLSNYTGKESITNRFLKILPLYYRRQREVNFYAEKLHVHPKYLSKAVKAATGKTAKQFIIEMVIMDAKALLINPIFPVSKVAEELDFIDQFQFTHFFKRYNGSSPSAYRKTLTTIDHQ